MAAVLLAFGVVFLAEFGDKTEIVTVALVPRLGPRAVLVAVVTATLLISTVSVTAGGLLRDRLPTGPATLAAALLFFAFAVWTICSRPVVADPAADASRFGASVLTATGTFVLTEIGDKTMLATIALAARHPPVLVWIGATTGVILADGIAIVVGEQLATHLRPRVTQLVSTTVFAAVGAALLVELVVG